MHTSTLAVIVAAAIETAFHEAAHVVPSSGAFGELVLTGIANAAEEIVLGAGTANELLGLPKNGLTINSATGITFTLPAEMAYPDSSIIYGLVPHVQLYALTVATGVLTQLFGPVGFAAPVWTPSARTIFLEDGSKDAAGVVRGVITF